MTKNNSQRKTFWPIVFIFLVFTALVLVFRKLLTNFNIDYGVLLAGNAILLAATLFSFLLYQRALSNDKPHTFLKYIYGGMFLKMLICLIAALIYIAGVGKNVNRQALFGCMFLYFLYTFVEVNILLRLSKEKKNAQTGSTP